MAYKTIILERKGHTALLTLNRPENLNAYNFEMHADLDAAWEEINADDNVRSVVTVGAGRAFCSGADMKERSAGQRKGGLGARRGEPPSDVINEWKHDARPHIGLPRAYLGYPGKPLIAAIHGICCGDGIGWLYRTDFAICSEDAVFFDPHVSVGAHPTSISNMHTSCARGTAMAMELLGLPFRMNAERAYEIGLVTEIVPRPMLLERALEIAEEINSSPDGRSGFRAARALYWSTMEMRLEEARNWTWAIRGQMKSLR